MPEKHGVPYRQTLQMRRDYIGKSCKLHFEVAPIKIVRASKQYLYDDTGQEFLDCVNNTSHVGHCHPHVVSAGQEQMAKLTSSFGFLNDQTALYAKRLISTLPESLCVCFFVSSGSEGNDLALRLAASYTKRHDVICLDGAYHGNLGTLVEISPVRHRKNHQIKDWVHIVCSGYFPDCQGYLARVSRTGACQVCLTASNLSLPFGVNELQAEEAPTPNTFRGKLDSTDRNPGPLYANEVRKLIQKAKQNGRDIGAFISEPVITASGIVVPPENYFTLVYNYVRESGGVCISDEVQCGLGRCGEHFWGFQMHNVVPDIVTIGKPIANGYPLAAVITTKEIADSLTDFSSTYGGNPVACAIGRAVLDVIENEKLMSSAKNVGKCLKDGFKAIQHKHSMIGDVRGVGMLVGVELVMDKTSKKPAKESAEILAYKLKEKKIIIGIEGADKNVLVLLPPLCFTTDNARFVVQNFSDALANIESEAASVGLTDRNEIPAGSGVDVPLDVITDQPTISVHSYSDDEEDDDDEDHAVKRARYEEVD